MHFKFTARWHVFISFQCHMGGCEAFSCSCCYCCYRRCWTTAATFAKPSQPGLGVCAGVLLLHHSRLLLLLNVQLTSMLAGVLLLPILLLLRLRLLLVLGMLWQLLVLLLTFQQGCHNLLLSVYIMEEELVMLSLSQSIEYAPLCSAQPEAVQRRNSLNTAQYVDSCFYPHKRQLDQQLGVLALNILHTQQVSA